MSRLITTSLIGSINWLQSCPPSWKDRAYTSLTNTLSRIWSEPGKEARLGIDFEKALYGIIEKNTEIEEIDKLNASDHFKGLVKTYVTKEIEIQKKIKRFIDMDGREYCLYGKVDIFHPEEQLIVDVKTTSKRMDDYSNKYLSTFQHHMYCFIMEILNFKYVVVAFNENTNTIRAIQEIEYHVSDLSEERKIIEDKIKEVFAFFGQHLELFKLYEEKYCLY